MNRYLYWLATVMPFALLTLYINKADSASLTVPFLLLLVYLPLIFNLRRKYLGMAWSDVLKSFVPFYGAKERYKILFA
ncbi:hypothetical protein H9Q13_06565 [Pontibacter sp. JH31]|uniref:Uncharacterized protein n=1 Tax=Pontibacter aquaedesilientis TaxID=2766980 RepID=A0ABR7XGU0_9BACT|nr:hypothetical protein [Pontibacter aquaedesilientis]MBD1396823.1 hypothetical protein [Pontibacter aquaedesilientis]